MIRHHMHDNSLSPAIRPHSSRIRPSSQPLAGFSRRRFSPGFSRGKIAPISGARFSAASRPGFSHLGTAALLSILSLSIFLIPPDRASAQSPLASQAESILRRACASCHTPGGDASDAMDYIASRDQLISNAQVIPGDASASPLFARVASRRMPPRNSGLSLSDSEIESLRRWIDSGAPDWSAAPPQPSASQNNFISDDAEIRAIAADLRSIPERQRRFMRYFTLAPLLNSGRILPEEMELHRQGVSKLMNSLSWRQASVPPKAIDARRSLYRIDLRDYRWNERTWELLARRDPYARGSASADAAFCESATGAARFRLRGDWFAREASRPPLYHELLGIPATERELESMLQIDSAEGLRQETAARAGFNRSGVSVNNRVIERHASPHGAYWKSYDFAGNRDRENIFKSPLGPAAGPGSFVHAGGEIIFNLPNGLQGYMLTNAAGARLDKAPTSIVSDPRRPDRAVENGVSCMACHERGVIPKEDQIRPLVERNPRAFGADAERILALYADSREWESLWKQDEERFRRALIESGVDPSAREPISAMVERYEAPLDLPRAAAEAGLPSDEFIARLPEFGAVARSTGALRVEGGTIQREAFEAQFPELARALGLPEESPRNSATGFFSAPSEGAPRPVARTRPAPRQAQRRPPLPRRTPAPGADDFWAK